MKRLVGYSRFIVLIAVVGFAALSVATFVWGAAKTVLLFDNLLEGKWRDEASLVKVLQITDTYLLALAIHHKGHLVTLDRRLQTTSVVEGESALTLILEA